MKNKISGMIVLGAGLALLLGGCGKVTGPISPLIHPPIASFGAFDDGTTDGWVFDDSNPVSVAGPITWTNQYVFQGPGALQLQIPDQGVSQGVTYNLTSYAVHYQFASAQDMTNKTFSVWIYFQSGIVTPPNLIGGQIFLKDSSYNYANGSFVKLTPGQWNQVTYNVNAPNYQAPPPNTPNVSQVLQVGVQISGSGSAVFTSPGVVDVDSFGY